MRSFNGFNSALQQEHFNENYLESDKFPTATYVGKLLDPIDLSKDASYQVRTKGIFTIHGVGMERILKHEITIKNKLLLLRSSFIISLEDYNISIPSIVNKKIAEEINVSLEAQLRL
ncbi:MAG: YceI family protein [Saprospiraceae bacterium]|nr:YceI family protein [Saprospiraceae bacterium]